MFEPIAKLDLHGPVSDGRGRELSWRRVSANAEGQADLSPLIGTDSKQAAYVWVPIVSPVVQKARLVVDTPADFAVWLGGKPVGFGAQSDDKNQPRAAVVDVPEGASELLIRVAAGGKSSGPASLVTTIVSDRPVGFNVAETGSTAPAAERR